MCGAYSNETQNCCHAKDEDKNDPRVKALIVFLPESVRTNGDSVGGLVEVEVEFEVEVKRRAKCEREDSILTFSNMTRGEAKKSPVFQQQ